MKTKNTTERGDIGLVLTRKVNQQIVIGDPGSEIIITVVRIRDDSVGIGVLASRDIPVHRKEISDLQRAADNGE